MSDFMRREIERAICEAEHPAGMSVHDGKARVSADLLRRLLAENEALRADAERWRFARSNCDVVEVTVLEDGEWYGHHTPQELDAAIDAARSKT